MNNIHPRVLDQLTAQLPPGSKITAVRVDENQVSYITVLSQEGVEQEARLSKTPIEGHFAGREAELTVDDGEAVDEVLKRFGERYNLFLVPGVDYLESDDQVVFGGGQQQRLVWSVADSSLLWCGELAIRLHNSAFSPKLPEKIVLCLDAPRIQVALAGKIFQGDGEVFTSNKSKLTLKFAKKVVAFLKDVGITSLSPNDIGTGEIIDAVADGFSGIAVVRPKKGPVLFIRFRSKGADLDLPTPGDEDSE